MNNPNQPQTMHRHRGPNTTLPKSRSSRSFELTCLASLASLLGVICFNESLLTGLDAFLVILSVNVCLWIVLELMFRFLNVFEEYRHLFTRHENNFFTLIKDVFLFPQLVGGVVAFACLYMLFQKYQKCPVLLWYQMGPWSLVTSLFFGFFLERAFNLRSGPLYDSLRIEHSNGLDYGSAMALSFFFGYLKLILPKSGSQEKDLKELMIDYEGIHQVKIEFYKLFILIPKSLYCPTSLKNEDNPSIEESRSLDDKVLTVAGVQNRVYKNSIYKIKDGNKFIYVCAEYATPLKTFKDGVNYNGDYSRFYQKHRNDIVLRFYKTLTKVLKEHENCTNFCELVFYDDVDENGERRDVGEILLRRIAKLKRSRVR